ncbi:MAG: glycoside hydrolase family 66 protein [Mycobacterium leprae]
MECYPHKAQYAPGDTVQILVEAPRGTVALEADLWQQTEVIARLRAEPGQPLLWEAPQCEWAAYGVQCRALDAEGALLAAGQTAFDVADHWSRAPRMGFMTDFSDGETLTETRRRMQLLTRLHVNCLDFYDWFYCHHSYIPPEEHFVDPLGRELSLISVRRKIRLASEAGIATVAYGPIYGADESFVREHPDWALYRSDGVPFNVARLFFIMDFRADSPWTAHILREYTRAVAELGFDGILIEQYGYPKRALPYPGHLGQASIDLSDHFLPFIVAAQAAITAVRPDSRVLFHAMNNWPLRKVSAGPQAANYMQVFSPYDTYRDLRDLIAHARSMAPSKAVILGTPLSIYTSASPEQADNALLLLTAVIHVAGGFQLVLGEGEGVLTEGYFPHYARLRPPMRRQMQAYYDFIVRYGPLLQAPPEADVSETHGGGVTEVYSFAGSPTSPMPTPGCVWTLVREHSDLVSIHLVNLTGTATGRWNEAQSPPPTVRNLTVTCKVLEPVAAVYWSTPDAEAEAGQLQAVPFTLEPDSHSGHLLRFVVPTVDCWSMVLIVPGRVVTEEREVSIHADCTVAGCQPGDSPLAR